MQPDDLNPLALANQICFSAYAVAHAFSRRYKALLAPLGVTYPQYLCLLVLWEHDGLTVTAIGERLQLDSGTLTPLLKRMEALGLLVRARSSEDERQVIIRLTDKGWGLKQQAAAIPPELICSTGLSLDEALSLKQKLDTLRKNLIASTAGAEA